MMDERRLEIIALCCSLLGIIFLLLFHYLVPPGDLKELFSGKKVAFTGKVVSVSARPSFTSFTVKVDEKFVHVQAFSSNLSMEYGDFVAVSGTVDDPERLSVNAEKIEYIR